MNLKSVLCAAIALACLTACSDDEKAPVVNTTKNIAGTYAGITMAEFPYSSIPMYTDDESLSLTSNTDGTVTVNFASADWGTTVVSSAVVTKGGDVYTLSGEGTSSMAMGGGTPKEYASSLTGTISADKSAYTFVVSLPIMGGTTLTFSNLIPAVSGTYEGTTTAEFPYSSVPMVTENESLSIVGKADGTCMLNFASADWGTTEALLTVVKEADGTYTLTGEGTSAMAMGGGTPNEYTCTVNGTVAADKSTCSMVLSLPIMGGTTLTFTTVSAE